MSGALIGEFSSDQNGKRIIIYLDQNYNRVIAEVTDSLKYNSNYDDVVYMGPLKVWLINSNEPIQTLKLPPMVNIIFQQLNKQTMKYRF